MTAMAQHCGIKDGDGAAVLLLAHRCAVAAVRPAGLIAPSDPGPVPEAAGVPLVTWSTALRGGRGVAAEWIRDSVRVFRVDSRIHSTAASLS
jgi:hypothetical protein